MTVRQFLVLVRRHRLLLAATTLLTALLALVMSFLIAPTYSASTQMFVTAGVAGKDANELNAGSTFAQERVKSYTQLITSPRVLNPVITSLKLSTSPEDLAKRITVDNPLETVVINVTAKADSAQGAANLANGVAAVFPKVVQEIETPSGSTAGPVKISITQEAVPPKTSGGPSRMVLLAAGLLLGALIGLGVSLFNEYRDTTVGDRRPPELIVGAPVIGTFARDAAVTRTPLITYDAHSSRADAFRYLRTNIRFLWDGEPVRSIVFTSAVAREGKSTIAANLAISMAQSGERVALIDADLRTGGLTMLMGADSGSGLSSVLSGGADLDSQLQVWNRGCELTFLPAGPPTSSPSDLIGSPEMASIVTTLLDRGYFVIIDSPPLSVTDAAVLAKFTDGTALVTNVGATTVDQLSAASAALRTVGAPILGVVLNNVPRDELAIADDAGRGAPRGPGGARDVVARLNADLGRATQPAKARLVGSGDTTSSVRHGVRPASPSGRTTSNLDALSFAIPPSSQEQMKS